MSVSSFSWEMIDNGVPDTSVIDFHSPTVSNRTRHRLTALLQDLIPGQMMYHIHSGKTAFSIFVSMRSRRMGVKLAYTSRDVKAVDPIKGEVLDGFILRHNDKGKRKYFRVRDGIERPVRPSTVPKLPAGHYWLWKANVGD